jgi:hypothetical protein
VPQRGHYHWCTTLAIVSERDRCLKLIDAFAAKRIDESGWPIASTLGSMSGHDWSRLEAKHLDHHLKQFSC